MHSAQHMTIGKKSSREKKIKRLHGALKGLLKDRSFVNNKCNDPNGSLPEILPGVIESAKVDHLNTVEKETQTLQGNATITENTGIMYIMSRENHLIPKLTDDQLMERHRQADENMKQVWTSIISKYESIEDQGDVLDLHTGEVIEDNGHIRGLSHGVKYHDTNGYTSTLKELLQIDDEQKDNEHIIWEEEEEESDEEYIQEEAEDSEEENEAQQAAEERYNYLSKKKEARRSQ